jgi:hypothetical protein
MFNFSEWLVQGIIDGFDKGFTSFARVTELTAAYVSKGFITEKQAEQIAIACPMEVDMSEDED